MSETTITKTQYNELATSTCTPTGGGSSVCTYQYAQKISTTTSTSTEILGNSTTTINASFIADSTLTIFLIITLCTMFGVMMYNITRKIT